MKAFMRYLSVLLVFSLMFGCSASAVETVMDAKEEIAVQTDNTDGLFLSLAERTSESLAFPLTKEHAYRVGQAGADKVSWTLHRIESYANPADGNWILCSISFARRKTASWHTGFNHQNGRRYSCVL